MLPLTTPVDCPHLFVQFSSKFLREEVNLFRYAMVRTWRDSTAFQQFGTHSSVPPRLGPAYGGVSGFATFESGDALLHRQLPGDGAWDEARPARLAR